MKIENFIQNIILKRQSKGALFNFTIALNKIFISGNYFHIYFFSLDLISFLETLTSIGCTPSLLTELSTTGTRKVGQFPVLSSYVMYLLATSNRSSLSFLQSEHLIPSRLSPHRQNISSMDSAFLSPCSRTISPSYSIIMNNNYEKY